MFQTASSTLNGAARNTTTHGANASAAIEPGEDDDRNTKQQQQPLRPSNLLKTGSANPDVALSKSDLSLTNLPAGNTSNGSQTSASAFNGAPAARSSTDSSNPTTSDEAGVSKLSFQYQPQNQDSNALAARQVPTPNQPERAICRVPAPIDSRTVNLEDALTSPRRSPRRMAGGPPSDCGLPAVPEERGQMPAASVKESGQQQPSPLQSIGRNGAGANQSAGVQAARYDQIESDQRASLQVPGQQNLQPQPLGRNGSLAAHNIGLQPSQYDQGGPSQRTTGPLDDSALGQKPQCQSVGGNSIQLRAPSTRYEQEDAPEFALERFSDQRASPSASTGLGRSNSTASHAAGMPSSRYAQDEPSQRTAERFSDQRASLNVSPHGLGQTRSATSQNTDQRASRYDQDHAPPHAVERFPDQRPPPNASPRYEQDEQRVPPSSHNGNANGSRNQYVPNEPATHVEYVQPVADTQSLKSNKSRNPFIRKDDPPRAGLIPDVYAPQMQQSQSKNADTSSCGTFGNDARGWPVSEYDRREDNPIPKQSSSRGTFGGQDDLQRRPEPAVSEHDIVVPSQASLHQRSNGRYHQADRDESQYHAVDFGEPRGIAASGYDEPRSRAVFDHDEHRGPAVSESNAPRGVVASDCNDFGAPPPSQQQQQPQPQSVKHDRARALSNSNAVNEDPYGPPVPAVTRQPVAKDYGRQPPRKKEPAASDYDSDDYTSSDDEIEWSAPAPTAGRPVTSNGLPAATSTPARTRTNGNTNANHNHNVSATTNGTSNAAASTTGGRRRMIGRPSDSDVSSSSPRFAGPEASVHDEPYVHGWQSGPGRSRSSEDVRPSFDDLTRWAPSNQIPGHSTLPHLPDWAGGQGRSAMPNSLIQQDVDYTMRRLLNEKVFTELLMDPLGRHRFREFMEAQGDASELDLWLDATQSAKMVDDLRANADALHDLYLARGSDTEVNLPTEVHRDLMMSLRTFSGMNASFETTQRYLLHKMYSNQFQDFVKHKIVQEMQVKIGKHNLSEEEQEGLGDCFCLTDPRLPDHPIVLVSEGFVVVTGYPKSQIVGRNCRFLQGPGTAPESVQRIRDGLNSGEGCTELLLNYRRNGEPFYCLLCILPLRDATGAIAYFIGGQINVTGVLSSQKNLGFLIGGEVGSTTHQTVGMPPPDAPLASPTMMQYKLAREGKGSTDALTTHSGSSAGKNAQSGGKKAKFTAAGSADIVTGKPSAATNLVLQAKNKSGSGFIGKILNRGGNSERQMLPHGAEQTLNGKIMSINSQLELFEETYSKLIIFKKEKREVIFVTPHMLRFLGLPCSSPSELYTSPLIHSDVVSFLTAGDKPATRQMRHDVKDAVKKNETVSVMCGFKNLGRNKIFGRNEESKHKFGVMHITPLENRDGACVAFVAVFG